MLTTYLLPSVITIVCLVAATVFFFGPARLPRGLGRYGAYAVPLGFATVGVAIYNLIAVAIVRGRFDLVPGLAVSFVLLSVVGGYFAFSWWVHSGDQLAAIRDGGPRLPDRMEAAGELTVALVTPTRPRRLPVGLRYRTLIWLWAHRAAWGPAVVAPFVFQILSWNRFVSGTFFPGVAAGAVLAIYYLRFVSVTVVAAERNRRMAELAVEVPPVALRLRALAWPLLPSRMPSATHWGWVRRKRHHLIPLALYYLAAAILTGAGMEWAENYTGAGTNFVTAMPLAVAWYSRMLLQALSPIAPLILVAAVYLALSWWVFRRDETSAVEKAEATQIAPDYRRSSWSKNLVRIVTPNSTPSPLTKALPPFLASAWAWRSWWVPLLPSVLWLAGVLQFPVPLVLEIGYLRFLDDEVAASERARREAELAAAPKLRPIFFTWEQVRASLRDGTFVRTYRRAVGSAAAYRTLAAGLFAILTFGLIVQLPALLDRPAMLSLGRVDPMALPVFVGTIVGFRTIRAYWPAARSKVARLRSVGHAAVAAVVYGAAAFFTYIPIIEIDKLLTATGQFTGRLYMTVLLATFALISLVVAVPLHALRRTLYVGFTSASAGPSGPLPPPPPPPIPELETAHSR